MRPDVSFQTTGNIPVHTPSMEGKKSEVQQVVRFIHSTRELEKAQISGTDIPVSDEQLIKAIEKAIKAVEGKATSLKFSVHEQTKQIMVKIIDNESGEIVKEIPPEKNLDFLAKVWEMAGLFIDERK
ncbi:flagellar protein FlaG [Marinicrinis lubricantis]|uniref:Flagellar protein FlaG n=1 Tax=Marinicrinis lubricantis TaxID=2086470 RepID=A0ABW1ISY7_9BACL